MDLSKVLIFHVVTIVIFLSIDCISSDSASRVSHSTNVTAGHGNGTTAFNDDIDDDYDTFDFGTLHTLQNLSRWAALEENISKVLTERLRLIKVETKLIKEYLKSYKETPQEAMKNVHEPMSKNMGEVVGSSAVLGHSMIGRYTSVISRLRELLQSPAYRRNQDHTEKILDLGENGFNRNETEDNLAEKTDLPIIWPGWADKYMSTITFLHVQEVYGYLAKDLRVGSKIDTNFGGTLNAHECAEIGMFALHRSYIYMAVQWLELAKKLTLESEDVSISNDIVSSMLNVAIQENNRKITYAKGVNQSDERLDVQEFQFISENIYIKPIREGMPEEKKTTGRDYYFKTKSDSHLESAQFSDLCREYTYQPPEVAAKLKCYYERKRHPYLYISPVKVEQLSEAPPVFQFYEMVGPNEIKRIYGIGASDMFLSQLVGEHGYEKITKYRTSVGSGLNYDDTPNVMKLAEMVTGLTLKNTSEPTQLAEYTYGRFYTHHTDALETEEEAQNTTAEIGDRLATILYYLELPESGGLTPFLNAGVSAHPVRGSAILWYNLYRNGSVRQDVNHGACPVIHGHKIIMNHWVGHLGNFQTFKCSLDQFE